MKVDGHIHRVDRDTIVVQVEVEQMEPVLLEIPRPLFNANILKSYAMYGLNDPKKEDSIRLSLEDLFAEAWVRHLRSRLEYWYKWWRKRWPTAADELFPIDILIGDFIPKCAGMGDNVKLQNAVRTHMRNNGDRD